MTYKLYLYKASAYSEDALSLDSVNRVLGTYKEDNWGDAENYMLHFDFSPVLSEMDNLIALNEDGTQKYKIHRHSTPTEHKKYLTVYTSFEKINEIVNSIKGIAIKHGVTIYDPQLEKTYFPDEPRRDQYAELKKRTKELLAIIHEHEMVFRIRKLEEWPSAYYGQASYAVTIYKNKESFENRVIHFANLLSSNIIEGERFFCRDECFHISAERYTITFVYEGYKKCADKIGYLDDENKPVVKLMHRMPCEKVWKLIPSLEYKDNYKFIYKSMRMEELEYKFPNPADRFVFIYKFQKQLSKFDGDVSYDPYHWYGADVRLNKVYEDGFPDHICCSYLKIEESFAKIFTPCVEKFYPYFRCRYYLTHNYLPDAMCWDILKEAKRVRHILATDPDGPETRQYLLEGNCEWLLNDTNEFWKAIGLMDIFIEWLEMQLEANVDMGWSFFINITGP